MRCLCLEAQREGGVGIVGGAGQGAFMQLHYLAREGKTDAAAFFLGREEW